MYTAHCTGQGAGADAAPVILFAPPLTGQARIDMQTVCLHRHRLGEEILIYRSGNIGNDSLVHYLEMFVDFIVPKELAEDMVINAMNSANGFMNYSSSIEYLRYTDITKKLKVPLINVVPMRYDDISPKM